MPSTVSGAASRRETVQHARRRPRSVWSSDPPGQHRAQAAHDCGVENVVEEDPSGEANDGGLNQKCQRRVSQREIAIRHLAQSDAKARVQRVACVPEDGEMRILPQDHGGAGQKERGRCRKSRAGSRGLAAAGDSLRPAWTCAWALTCRFGNRCHGISLSFRQSWMARLARQAGARLSFPSSAGHHSKAPQAAVSVK